MTTKEQERQAIEKIRKIVEGLGENSYVGFAMEGVLELAEDNIREDTAYSMKKNAEIAWERADKAETENKDLKKEVEDLKKTVEKRGATISELNTVEPDVGDNTYHRADGKVETKICDMGECAERNEPTHDRKLHPVSERDGAHGVHEQL